MPIKKVQKQLKIRYKYLISAGVLVTSVGITFGGIYGYALNSFQVQGHPYFLKNLNNAFVFDDATVQKNILSGDKKTKLGFWNEKTDEIVANGYKQKWHDFITTYYHQNKANIILHLKYGPFNFYNEYPEAVSGVEFKKFTDWFVQNVPWGVEATTLKSFSIVRGVERKGNAITLGEHENKNKEATEITFYPDAFFGSAPIYSELSGAGNADDALTYKINQNLWNDAQAQTYLEQIPLYNVIANDFTPDSVKISFDKLTAAHLLVGTKLFFDEQNHYVVNAANTTAALMLLKQQYPNSSFNAANLKYKVISKVVINPQRNLVLTLVDDTQAYETFWQDPNRQIQVYNDLINQYKRNRFLPYDLEQKMYEKSFENATAKIELTLGRFEDASVFALDQINQAWQQQFVNVYDLYHIKRFFFHKYFYYYEGHKELFADKISAWDGINKDFDPQKLHQVSLVQINHNANKNKFELVLAKTKDKPSGATTSFSFLELNNDSQALIKLEVSQTDLAFFTSLSVALGYKKQVQPELVYKEDEIRFNDDHIEKKYRIYNAAYQDLLDTLKQQAPNALLPLQGEHLQKYVDQKGSLRYRIANGFYWGFRPSTDVPLWAILKASKPTFSGISHDFLKFVAAHEYGHHLTLTTLQDVSDKGTSPLLIGALRPNSPPTSIQNYWNKSLVELFLNARTNLTVTGQKLKDLGTNVLSETGEYPVFGFRSQNNKPVFETYEDVFGDALLSNNLAATLANKKRRFLQNYDGLKQAVAERKKAGINNISLSDLYLLNSWDTSSGTINPGFSGNAKFLFWNQQQQKYQFQPASVQNLARVITDGLNQPIRFSSFNRPMVLRWNRSYNQVEAILIHNKDGSPVFNVPLNTPLSRDEISAIRVKERQIQDLILSLNVANYSVNGWELPTTNFDPKIVTSIAINHFVQWVNNRDLTNEEVVLMDEDNRKITDYFPLFGDKIPGFVFFFLNPRISETAKIFLESIFNSKLVSGSDKGIYTFDKEEAKEQIAKIVYFFKNNVSVLSYLAGSLPPDLAGISNFSDLITDLGTNYEKYGFTNEQELSKNQINVLYWQFLDFIYKFESKDTQKRATDTTGLLFKIDNNYYSINPNHTLSFKEVPGFQTIDRAGTLLKALVSFDASKPFIWTNDDNEQVSLNEDTIKTTPNTSLKLNPKFSIFNANAEKKQKFSTLKELFTFVAIDYTKFDGTNWDVNYVKEKFDIEKIKIAKPEWQNASDQMVANATMAAFMRSDSAFLMQVRFFNELNAQNFGWVFNQTNGLKGYQNPSVDDTNKTKLWEQIDQFVTDNGLQKDKLTSLDLIFFSPSVRVILPQYNNDRDLEANLAGFSPIFLSQDVIDYFNLKTEARLDDKFANYVFDPAEWTNRDWLQISYSPGVSAFGDAPGFIGNLNEANSGFEYVVDGYASQKWANLATDFLPGLRAIYTHLSNTRDTNLLKVNDLFAIRQPRNSNFLGKLRSISNGWYKDRFFREKTDGLIYDDMGMSIHDDTINITDFQGKKVTDRAYAMWIYLLRSQYIGNGNLTQIWRNDDLDAISMFGYLRSDIAHQVAYLALENLANKEIVYVPVHTKNTSNLFYYKTQNPTNETNTNARHYLKDEAWVDGDQKGVGFVGWVSDYMISGNYQNALLKPNNKYKLYFVNQNKQYVANLSLGNRQSAAENGKAYSQAPVRAQKVNDGVEVEVRSQFNV